MKTLLSIPVLGLFLLSVAPATARDGPADLTGLHPLDYDAWSAVLPEMSQIAKASKESIYRINRLMNALLQEADDKKAAKLREEIRPELEKHRQMKIRMIELVDKPLKRGKPELTDLEALRALHNTSLRRVTWRMTFLKHVVRDISQAIGVPIRLNARVQELNQVDISFPEVNAEAVLGLICNNFDLKWIIHGGEIHVFRKLNRNEERFLGYESRHGKVDWISEAEIKFAKDVEVKTPKRELAKLEAMDLRLLKANLLKLYVLEGESVKHEKSLEKLEVMAKILDEFDERDNTAEEEKVKIKRHKHITHYLYMERDNAMEVADVLGRVLGIHLELEGEDAELRKLLDTEIPKLEWNDVELRDALVELGRYLGVDVEVDLPPFTELRVNLTVENVTAETVIGIVCEIHPLDWRYVNGKLLFAHQDR